MRSTEPAALGVREAAAAVRAGTVSPVELVEASLAQIAALDGQLLAWAHVDAAGARAIARERESEARGGRLRGPLHGVPVGVKDIFDVAGMPTTGGARAFAHTRPTADAAAVARIRAAGAIVLGKTVTTEFAYRDPAPTRNPWNHGHTPGEMHVRREGRNPDYPFTLDLRRAPEAWVEGGVTPAVMAESPVVSKGNSLK